MRRGLAMFNRSVLNYRLPGLEGVAPAGALLVSTLTPEELDRQLATIIARLRGALDPSAIYLFGSYAYGHPQSHSDLDLLVVVPESRLSAYQRDALAYLALGDIQLPVDVQVYTQAEFDARARLPVSFERTVRTKGRIVYAA